MGEPETLPCGMDDLLKICGRQVSFHRRRHGMTQADLADRASLSVDMIAKLEVGTTAPSLRTIGTLAAILHVDPAELLTTQVVGLASGRPVLSELVSRIQGLSDDQVLFVKGVVEAALRRVP